MNMYIVRENGTPIYLFNDETDTVHELYPVTNRNAPLESESTSSSVLKRKYTKKGKKVAKVTGRVAHCKNCGGVGHFAKTCPEKDGSLPPDEVASRPEITKEQVDELRAKGLDSLRIAAKLHTTLAEVNKHW